jgi:Zn-dependent protease
MKEKITKYFYTTISFIIFLLVLYYLLDLSLFFSIGITLIIFVHELGHIVALGLLKKNIDGLYFLPLFGAMVKSKNDIDNMNDYAFLKYLGPFTGMIGIVFIGLLYFIFKDIRLLELVYMGAIFNIINMIPVVFLDGYGILKGVGRWIRWLGFITIAIVGLFVFKVYVFTLMLMLLSVLYDEDTGTGFYWYEAFIASLFVFGMIVVTVIGDSEYLISNIAYILFSIYAFIQYLRATLTDYGKNFKQTILKPLSLKQKYIWGTRWLGLLFVLILIVLIL